MWNRRGYNLNDSKKLRVTRADIEEARRKIAGVVRRTGLEISREASKKMDRQIYFKMEHTQITGSFKLRGALNKIQSLSEEDKKRGVIASSAGNHAQGVAYSATNLGVKSTIVMPVNAPLIKTEATRSYGAEVIHHGEIVDDATDRARQLEMEHGFVFIHPYQDELIIAGQGTIGLEIFEDLPDVDTVIVPIGGGGLISGVAVALKSLNPKIRVIGVVSDKADGMAKLYSRKDPYIGLPISTIADGIAIKKPSQLMFDSFISQYVDEIVSVSDDEIADAIVFALEKKKAVLEGAGAAGLAALFSRTLQLGNKVCVLLCGGNIDLNTISQIIQMGQIHRGRLCELSVIVADVPGNLSVVVKILAEMKANVLEVHHNRILQGLHLRETKIDFVVETKSLRHIEEIKARLIQQGIRTV